MKWLSKLGLLFLISVALASWIPANYLWAWGFALGATELGHWWAIVATLALLASVWKLFKKPTFFRFIQLALVIFCLATFLKPLGIAYLKQEQWRAELAKAFGQAPTDAPLPPLLSFKELWKAPRPDPHPVENYWVLQKDVPGLRFNFYRPQASQPTPWILVIHGGSWRSGDPTQLAGLNSILMRQGYAVVAISYRFAPQWRWPAQRQDVLSALAYVRSQAKKLNIDPSRWVVLGRSAGAQLAQSIAYTSADPTLKGCVSFYGPSDLEFGYQNSKETDILAPRQLLRDLLGGTPEEVPTQYRNASPLQFVTKNAPATLILHGKFDTLVWHKHSERLHEKLQKLNVPTALISLDWATHGFDFNLHGPGGQVSTYSIEYFLNQVLPITK